MSDASRKEPVQQVMEDIRRFMGSRAVLSGAELDVFSHLDRAPADAEELADRLGADRRGLTRLLDSLVVLGYLHKDQGRYLPSGPGRLLSAERNGSLRPMALHMGHVWRGWSHLTETVLHGTNPEKARVTAQDEATCRAFIGAMDAVGASLAEEIAAAYPLPGRRRLLDVGGGCGTYTAAFLRRNPELQAVLFDLPRVVPMAQEKLEQEGLRGRVQIAAGDFYREELPRGCDAALLSAIIHQNSPGENFELFSKVSRALEPGGLLIIRDHIMDPQRTEPPDGALFAINMLVNTPGGDTYTFEEVRGALDRAGFEDIRMERHGERMDCLVVASRR